MKRIGLAIAGEVAFATAFLCCALLTTRPLWARFSLDPSPVLLHLAVIGPGLAAMMLASTRALAWRMARTPERVGRRLRWATGLSAAVVLAAMVDAVSEPTGLWREWLDRSAFTPELIRSYGFAPRVGLAGLMATAVAYLAWRLRAIGRHGRLSSRASMALSAAPLALFALILLRQFWVPAPRFVG